MTGQVERVDPNAFSPKRVAVNTLHLESTTTAK
jgi:hypothetical protein